MARLLAALVVEVAVMPVAIGGGVPMLSPGGQRAKLNLTRSKIYHSGIALLEYDVEKESTG